MKVFFQIIILIVSMLAALHVFGNDNYDSSFSQMYLGFVAIIVCFADIINMYGTKEDE